MSATSHPKVSISLLAAQLAASIVGRNDLICGSIPSTATATVSTLYTDVAAKTKTELDTLFGVNSDVRNRIDQFISSNGGYSTLNVQVVADGTTPAVGTFAFGTGVGTATAAGTIRVTLVDETQFFADIAVAIGDTDQDVVDAIVAAFAAANFPSMPVVVTENGVSDFQVDVTSIDGGTIGNAYKIDLDGTIAGLGTVVTVQPTGGATDPVVTTFFDSLQSTRFTGINWPTAWISQITVVKTYLDDRFNSANAILDGVAFIGLLGTFASNKAVVLAQNSQSLCFGGNTAEIFQPADWAMSYFQGVRARRLTAEAPIASFITSTSGALDAFGGPALASLPYFNTPLKILSLVDPNLLYSQTEQDELEVAGYSVYGVNSAENAMITGPMVTSYTTDSAGNPNESFHFLNYVDTSSVCREYFFANLKSRFSQSRLTNGTLVPDRSIENEVSIRAEFSKIYKQLSQLALTVAGSDAEKFFLENLSLTLDLAARSVTAAFQMPIVTQLGTIIVTAQLNFNFQEV